MTNVKPWTMSSSNHPLLSFRKQSSRRWNEMIPLFVQRFQSKDGMQWNEYIFFSLLIFFGWQQFVDENLSVEIEKKIKWMADINAGLGRSTLICWKMSSEEERTTKKSNSKTFNEIRRLNDQLSDLRQCQCDKNNSERALSLLKTL